MKCPHCLVSFHLRNFSPTRIGSDPDGYWWVAEETCPDCKKLTVWLVVSSGTEPGAAYQRPYGQQRAVMVRPKGTNHPPVSIEVPPDFAEDYLEACLVIADSPKASAALSRRCLQHILREKAGVKHPNDLAEAIQEVIDDPAVPSDVSATLDMVRNIGNFSVHPNKSLNTGEIVNVEPMEAEWCLDTIEILFDFYFVRPADIEKRRQAVNEKLAETGKPQMPTPDR
jgi:hypothetical protein